ncbi:hypothetical protein [Pseudonocardia spinosispora]|uniref:hypothetical protein n=1 Tax=Pseudonocardia spinosispora TaxID=103441 RepID=UPI00040C3479|nr:hypothetical protein [Pseudonocardia spinosispora]
MRRPALPPPVRVLSLAAALLLLPVVACGATPPPPPPAPLPHYSELGQLGAAVDNQLKLDRTAKITVAGSITGGGRQITTTGDQLISYDPAGPSIQFTQKVQEQGTPVPSETTMIILPDQAWLKPPAGSGLPLGKAWLKVPTSSEVPEVQQVVSIVEAVRQGAEMARSFTQFGAAAAITESAEDPVAGIRAERYRIRLDLAKAAELQPDPAIREQMRTAAIGASSIDATLWLDAHNRLLRQLIQQPLPGGGGIQTTDAHYSAWGEPVQITPPPADQIIDDE